MKRLFKTAVMVIALAFCLSLGGAQPAAAAPATTGHPECSNVANPLNCVCTTPGADDAAACSADPNTDPIAGKNGVLKRVSLLLALLGGVIAVIMIIVGGLQYIFASGDAQKAAKARETIQWAAIGLVVIVVAYSLVVFVVSKLV